MSPMGTAAREGFSLSPYENGVRKNRPDYSLDLSSIVGIKIEKDLFLSHVPSVHCPEMKWGKKKILLILISFLTRELRMRSTSYRG